MVPFSCMKKYIQKTNWCDFLDWHWSCVRIPTHQTLRMKSLIIFSANHYQTGGFSLRPETVRKSWKTVRNYVPVGQPSGNSRQEQVDRKNGLFLTASRQKCFLDGSSWRLTCAYVQAHSWWLAVKNSRQERNSWRLSVRKPALSNKKIILYM
jgi:hypothetical protein